MEFVIGLLGVVIPAALKIFLEVKKSQAADRAKGKAIADVEEHDTMDAMARVDAEQRRLRDEQAGK